ncbi:MAG: ATPase [Candidatus Magasanikbacteria bacterium RIFCSPLOWO2_01_FULL_43_20b]|uniref:ATPase n=1 Tax=Candidatus Magasanikbacteria bacterium RIFCSPLOWO2_12_FULL_43_12 TaxID=1798692 RepID=A0A1F6MRB5_9BACT|nr:MAG: ATPase [Candidatus Magasanikbacteria bacterium RIFCSPHIGHO2_02_FULL_44_13]OGH72296.1 MAG: ATPase [Candidatus Magasanikbacteria bacterium RIFCSPLOWO2_02_FULL_43_22]OGH73376.1 MAG: ATPase [Candidatus Magasanikbacteria bacterium RIFCSPLOWO2_01_FULL_43_20b]OGH74206.1 MAG: ATPase [Candidatus Magasanikbacteria bacterium RIFCSPLOWO2_12_FULL_43_12]
MLIPRILQQKIDGVLFKNKVILLFGARQVGKTTLLREIQKKRPDNSVYLNCDEPDVRASFTNTTSTALGALIKGKKLVLLDEAQRVNNIGLTLKLMADNFPETQVIATGSSAFELSNKTIEPLTGRKHEFFLFPFSVEELKQVKPALELKRLLPQMMIYGLYPEVEERSGDAENIVKELARSYSYKDVLQYQGIRNPELLEKLLQAVALQIGNEVSYNELGRVVGANKATVINYLSILEKAFIIFRLRPYSRNQRKELSKMHKIYFYDTGIRNALINNFNPLQMRADIGALWENFWISERIKNNNNHGLDVNKYFWRTYSQQEVDYVEEAGGKLQGFECKWSESKKAKAPSEWAALYSAADYQVITPDSFF